MIVFSLRCLSTGMVVIHCQLTGLGLYNIHMEIGRIRHGPSVMNLLH